MTSEQAFKDGFRTGVEQAVQALDDLPDIVADLIYAVCESGCPVLVQPSHERTMASVAKAAALRTDEAEEKALALYAIEQAS